MSAISFRQVIRFINFNNMILYLSKGLKVVSRHFAKMDEGVGTMLGNLEREGYGRSAKLGLIFVMNRHSTKTVNQNKFKLGQKLLLGRDDVDQLPLKVQTSVVSFFDLPGVKPSLSSSDCSASVQTYSFNEVNLKFSLYTAIEMLKIPE